MRGAKMEDQIVMQNEYKGYTITVYYDCDPVNNPREWSSVGTMLCAHKRYDFGDVQLDPWYLRNAANWHEAFALYIWNEYFVCAENAAAIPNRKLMDKMYKVDADDKWVYLDEETILNDDGIKMLLGWMQKNMVWLPLYVYEHGGVTMKTTPFLCEWDSGQVGFIYVMPDKVRSEYGALTEATKKQAEQALEAEVDVYDRYLRGDVYGYEIEKDGNEIDRCDGYIQDADEVFKLAIEVVEQEIEEELKRSMPLFYGTNALK